MSTYEYQPIQDPRSIRVLHLEPSADHESTPRYILKEVSLDSSLEYEAVSYTWGPPERTETINSEGKTLLVTKNCMQLLQHFGGKAHTNGIPRTLWIDAICINQESADERTRQVQLMGDVYGKAKRVLIWLGEGDEESASTFSYISEYAQSAIPGRELVYIEQLALRLRIMGYYERHQLMNAVIKTTTRPWFTRMWPLQELALGTEIVVHCGDNSLSWNSFARGIHCLYQAYYKSTYSRLFEQEELREKMNGNMKTLMCTALDDVLQLDLKRRAVATKTGLTIPDLPEALPRGLDTDPPSLTLLLRLNHHKHCTDPKDKIFALYGVTQALQMEMSKPDYANSLEKIYTDAARAAISHDKNLLLLHTIITTGRMPGAPSWVPNWKAPPTLTVMQTQCYNAAKDSEPEFSFSPDGQRLTITGIYVDEIISRAGAVTPIDPMDIEQDPSKLLEVFRPMRACLSRHSSPPSPKEAFFRTITLDGAFDQGDPERFRDAFERWFPLVIEDTKTDLYTALASALDAGSGDLSQDVGIFLSKVTANMAGKAYFVTKKGYVGAGMHDLEVGDSLVVFSGVSVPYILRRGKMDEEGRHCTYTLIGPAYAHGIMYGQAWDKTHGQLEEFTLV
ncbi:Heterokaryon incompatibility protein (HET) domain containing protein [Naviculisporaceae sp. PSN 640]